MKCRVTFNPSVITRFGSFGELVGRMDGMWLWCPTPPEHIGNGAPPEFGVSLLQPNVRCCYLEAEAPAEKGKGK